MIILLTKLSHTIVYIYNKKYYIKSCRFQGKVKKTREKLDRNALWSGFICISWHKLAGR